MLKLLLSYVNFLIPMDNCNKENFIFRNQFRDFNANKLMLYVYMCIYIHK